jgi:hypothetical protein
VATKWQFRYVDFNFRSEPCYKRLLIGLSLTVPCLKRVWELHIFSGPRCYKQRIFIVFSRLALFNKKCVNCIFSQCIVTNNIYLFEFLAVPCFKKSLIFALSLRALIQARNIYWIFSLCALFITSLKIALFLHAQLPAQSICWVYLAVICFRKSENSTFSQCIVTSKEYLLYSRRALLNNKCDNCTFSPCPVAHTVYL